MCPESGKRNANCGNGRNRLHLQLNLLTTSKEGRGKRTWNIRKANLLIFTFQQKREQAVSGTKIMTIDHRMPQILSQWLNSHGSCHKGLEIFGSKLIKFGNIWILSQVQKRRKLISLAALARNIIRGISTGQIHLQYCYKVCV